MLRKINFEHLISTSLVFRTPDSEQYLCRQYRCKSCDKLSYKAASSHFVLLQLGKTCLYDLDTPTTRQYTEVTYILYMSPFFQNAVYEAVKSFKHLSWEFLEGSSLAVTELARKIFAHPIISDFLIYLSRLDVFSKELASSFSSDLESLLLIRKLKYFYNQPTVAVLQQLASLVPR